MTFAAALVFSLAALAATTPRKGPPIRNRGAASSGGLVFSEATGKHLCVLNAQKTVSRSVLEEGALAIKKQLLSPIEVIDNHGAEDVDQKVRLALADPKVAAVVAFIDDETADSLVFYPDRGYAVVNVKALAKDGAPQDRISERTRKDVWRAFGFVLGAGDVIGGFPSVLKRATTLEELDAIKGRTPSPEQHNRMVDSITLLGVKMVRVASYRDACEQGWAPAPTNDVQKAIWDKVHQMPSEPLKIKPETKKLKD